MLTRFPTFLVYIILLALAVPWYWDSDFQLIWFGFPAWVVTSVLISLIASIVTCVIFLKSHDKT